MFERLVYWSESGIEVSKSLTISLLGSLNYLSYSSVSFTDVLVPLCLVHRCHLGGFFLWWVWSVLLHILGFFYVWNLFVRYYNGYTRLLLRYNCLDIFSNPLPWGSSCICCWCVFCVFRRRMDLLFLFILLVFVFLLGD